MSKYYYKLLIDSPVGKQLTQYWHNCQKCEQEAEKYAKKMGGQYYYPDTKYFAGGVTFISFHGNKPSDPLMWREVGTQYEDGHFQEARDPNYKGPSTTDDVVYFEPNVSKRIDYSEIPNKDYRPADTFDCIHSTLPPLERNGKFFIQCVRFVYDEPPGHSGSKANRLRTASRSVRRAIKAEVKRTRLPVMRVEPLLELLGADCPVSGDAIDATPVSTTPTFFPYLCNYYIGCDYPCHAEGLSEITPQIYRMYQCKAERSIQQKGN